jgi:Tol biopolymer transport system component
LTDLNADCRQPNWSPDGHHILYQALEGGQWDIWIMKSDGTDQRQVTAGSGVKLTLRFLQMENGSYTVLMVQI